MKGDKRGAVGRKLVREELLGFPRRAVKKTDMEKEEESCFSWRLRMRSLPEGVGQGGQI